MTLSPFASVKLVDVPISIALAGPGFGAIDLKSPEEEPEEVVSFPTFGEQDITNSTVRKRRDFIYRMSILIFDLLSRGIGL